MKAWWQENQKNLDYIFEMRYNSYTTQQILYLFVNSADEKRGRKHEKENFIRDNCLCINL